MAGGLHDKAGIDDGSRNRGETEAEDVELAGFPLYFQFNAPDEVDSQVPGGCFCFRKSCKGVVIGEGDMGHAQ